MKNLSITLVAFLMVNFIYANTYYFSSSGNDNSDGLSPLTSFRTLQRLNSLNLLNGDILLFNRGDEFFGSLNIPNNISVSSYGTGLKPVITGLSTLKSWENYGNGIYFATLTSDLTYLNMVTLNGVPIRMGRTPNVNTSNGGYDFISSSNQTSVSGLILNTTKNYLGAEIAIRCNNSVIDRHTITVQKQYTVGWDYDNIVNSWPLQGNGYFIQNSLLTLDEFNEWYYEPSTKRLYMYFGSANPNNYVIKASTINSFFSKQSSNISFSNLSFDGANTISLFFSNDPSTNIQITNCEFTNCGISAIQGQISNSSISFCSINNALSNGINIGGVGNKIENNSIKNVGILRGMGESHYGSYLGILIYSFNQKKTIISNNYIDSVGYMGINFTGDSITIQYNVIKNIGFHKDDGGAIYSYNKGDGAPIRKGRKIIGNIVSNVTNAQDGTNNRDFFTGNGIYLDDESNGTEVLGNTAYNCVARGIFIHDAYNTIIRNNLSFNNTVQFYTQADGGNPLYGTNNFCYQNTFFSLKSGDDVVDMFDWRNNSNMIPNFYTADSNYYCRPMNELTSKPFVLAQSEGFMQKNLQEWKDFSNQDKHSKGSPMSITDTESISFKVNDSNYVATKSLIGAWVDVRGNYYVNSISLQPFSSIVLFKTDKALPLTWISFEGEIKLNVGILTWKTANEINNNYFEIQKSIDNITFKKLGQTNNYTFRDNTLFTGLNYYRLKQVDKNGDFTYSKTIALNYKTSESIVISPNPASKTLTVVLNNYNSRVLVIRNVSGQILKTIIVSSSVININISDLPAGIYFLNDQKFIKI